MDEYNFFFVASKKRLDDGCTPYARLRTGTEAQAIDVAKDWAAKSEHGGEYIVFRCTAVGAAQRSEPPVGYREIKPKRGKRK